MEYFLVRFFSLWDFVLLGYFPTWDFVLWDFVLMGFYPLGFFPHGIFSYMGFCPPGIFSYNPGGGREGRWVLKTNCPRFLAGVNFFI